MDRGVLHVDTDRTNHVDRTKPEFWLVTFATLSSRGTYAITNEAGIPINGMLINDLSVH